MLRFGKATPRKHARLRMRRGGWLTYDGAAVPIPCMVWDFSEGGCRLSAPHVEGLPEVFVLVTGEKSGPRHFCRIAWQKGAFVGVKFIDAAEAERVSDSLPTAGTTGQYRKNDPASWTATRKAAGELKVSAPKAQTARKRTRFNVQLY